MNRRIIARLDIKGPNLVKGIHLEGLRVLGRPDQYAEFYYHEGADELIYMDVVASLYGRNSLHGMISKLAERIFIPLTVGGGIRSIEDINGVLRAGADKVCINTAAINNPELIRAAARKFGSSTIVVAIEAIKQPDGAYHAFTDNGREPTGVDAVEWAQRAAELGAGEILITSVDHEGTGLGFNHELVDRISRIVSIPVIAHGGAGKLDHITQLLQDTPAAAVAIASMIHYDFVKNHKVEFEAGIEGNFDFLKSGRTFSRITTCSISDIKNALQSRDIPCRPWSRAS